MSVKVLFNKFFHLSAQGDASVSSAPERSTPEPKVRVLFVCMGNICRSPTARGVFEKLVEEAGLSHAIETGQAAIDLDHEQVLAAQAGIDVRRLVCTADKKGRSGDERERQRELHHEQRIARQEAPATAHHIFATMLLQVLNRGRARKLKRRAEAETKGAGKTENQRGREQRRCWSGEDNHVDWHEPADGRD